MDLDSLKKKKGALDFSFNGFAYHRFDLNKLPDEFDLNKFPDEGEEAFQEKELQQVVRIMTH